MPASEVCLAAYDETSVGHDYQPEVTAPTCTTKGYTVYTCSRCFDSYTGDEVAALSHWYGPWTGNGDAAHVAQCKRYGCRFVQNMACIPWEVTVNKEGAEEIITICPVCGDYQQGVFAPIENAVITSMKRNALPYGEQIVRGAAVPFEGVLYAFTLVHADASYHGGTGERTGEWKGIAFTFENGSLTFETDTAGLFLLLPVE